MFYSLYSIYTESLKHVLFRILCIYGNYRILISSKFLQNNHFDSVFNRIFDHVQGTHCFTSVVMCYTDLNQRKVLLKQLEQWFSMSNNRMWPIIFIFLRPTILSWHSQLNLLQSRLKHAYSSAPRFSSTFPFYNNAASHWFVNIVFSYK